MLFADLTARYVQFVNAPSTVMHIHVRRGGDKAEAMGASHARRQFASVLLHSPQGRVLSYLTTLMALGAGLKRPGSRWKNVKAICIAFFTVLTMCKK